MDITPITPKGRQLINRYGNGGFVVSEISHKGNVLILPGETLTWEVASLREATAESLSAILNAVPLLELLLIGTGQHFTPMPAPLLAALRGRNIGVDVMDRGAACRTYNVLLSEDRRVAAALIAV